MQGENKKTSIFTIIKNICLAILFIIGLIFLIFVLFNVRYDITLSFAKFLFTNPYTLLLMLFLSVRFIARFIKEPEDEENTGGQHDSENA